MPDGGTTATAVAAAAPLTPTPTTTTPTRRGSTEPAGSDLCDEYSDGKLNDELVEFVYPGHDADVVADVLEDHC